MLIFSSLYAFSESMDLESQFNRLLDTWQKTSLIISLYKII